ncbi:MAG: alkene reductase [Candidatus Krumholzibacteriia bacterium]
MLGLALQNRVVMAPMTRSMADDALVPTPEMAAYYARRADAGLIVTEATIVRPDGQGYPNTPGIYDAAQVLGWRRVTDQVHERGGKIFVQIWHVGRVSHPIYLNGELPIAPSAVPLSGRVPRGDLEYGTPRELRLDEIPSLVEAFARAAENARAAHFDGVEVHGGNGYLIDQFLHHHTNRRHDAYGGSPESMARFALDVVDAVAQRIGHERVGIRLSPGAYFHMEPDPADPAVFRHLLARLDERRLAYVHTAVFDGGQHFEDLGGSANHFLRRNYEGTLIGNGGYTPDKAAAAILNGAFDLVAIGRPFIANPDLIARVQGGEALRPYQTSMLERLD